MNDLKYALRQLRRNPGFTAVAVLTLGLGIGANTAIFSLVHELLMRPLPYPDAERLVRIGSVNLSHGVTDSRSSAPDIADWQEQSVLFDELAAYGKGESILTLAGQSQMVRCNDATPNLLSLLDAKPALGRLLAQSDVGTDGVALPFGLLTAFNKAMRLDPGFSTENRASIQLAFHNPDWSLKFFPRLLDAVSDLPGVNSVGAANHELMNDLQSVSIRVSRDPENGGEALEKTSDLWLVTRDFFSAAGIPLLAGRDFLDHDTEVRESELVINEALAQQMFPEKDPIGRGIRLGNRTKPHKIIGVVGSIQHHGLTGKPIPMLYLYRTTRIGNLTMMAHFEGAITPQLPKIADTIRRVAPEVVIGRVVTSEDLVAQSMAGPRFAVRLISFFAALGALLAALGFYGVMTYTVMRQGREIGIRLALGADRATVKRQILGRGMRLTACGIALGLLGGLALGKILRGLVFEVKVNDPITMGIIALVLATVAFLTCILPARRATRIHPMEALRHE
jgi:putative ABC transport system permease protein